MKKELLITDIAKQFKVKKAGKNKYHCPLHDDKSPSLMLYDPGWGECLSCGTKFNPVTFVMAASPEVKNTAQAESWLSNHYEYRKKKRQKYHIRFVQNQSNKEEHRFIWADIEPHEIYEPDVGFCKQVEEKLNKKYSLKTLQRAGVKTIRSWGNSKWDGIVFLPTGENRSLVYGTITKQSVVLHLEGRTDWLSAIELELDSEFILISNYNKQSLNPIPNHLNIFILDADAEEADVTKNIKTKCRVKFVRLPEKDLSDYVFSGGLKEDVLKAIEEAEEKMVFEDGLTIEEIAEQVQEYEVGIKHKDLEPVPIIKIGDAILVSRGNLAMIAGGEGTMKSSFLRMIAAGAIAVDDSWLNLCDFRVTKNIDRKAVLYFDTEQSLHRQGKALDEILRRARLTDPPDFFYMYDFTALQADDLLSIFDKIITIAAMKHNGIHTIFIDQVGDFLYNINDIPEVHKLMVKLRGYAKEFDTAAINVIHFNPGTEKERGHVGSELRRKVEMNINIERDERTGFSELKFRKLREANEWDLPVYLFGYSKEKGMITDMGKKTRSENEGNRLEQVMWEIFKDLAQDVGLKRIEIHNAMVEKRLIEEDDKGKSKRDIKKCVDKYDILTHVQDGQSYRYHLNPDIRIKNGKGKEAFDD